MRVRDEALRELRRAYASKVLPFFPELWEPLILKALASRMPWEPPRPVQTMSAEQWAEWRLERERGKKIRARHDYWRERKKR